MSTCHGQPHHSGNSGNSGQVHRELFQSNSRSSEGCVTEEVIDRLVYKLQLLLLVWSRQTESKGLKRKKRKILSQLKLVAFVGTHIPPT